MTQSRPARRRPGESLCALLAEADWSGEALAVEVNAIGAESGLSLRYGRASVAQWLSGARPRPPVPGLIAEALSRRLRRRTTPAELGYAEPAGESVPWWEEDPVARLSALCAAAGSRRLGTAFVYRLEPPPAAGWEGAVAVRAALVPRDATSIRVGRDEVDAAGTMLRLFSATDAAHGAGATRPAVADYLATAIGPWLRAPTTGPLRRDLFSVAARMAYLCGFLCVDDRLDGLAQRYYLSALRLSAEADDPAGYAVTLRGMSLQAHTLGHPADALDLAEAAARAGTRAPRSTRAFLDGQVALACAANGERHRALAHLRSAERRLDHDAGSASVVGTHHWASLAHQEAAVLARLGDRPGAMRALERSIRHRPATERRSRLITVARLAELRLRHGRIDHAVETWHRFLDDYPAVRSARARAALSAMRAMLRPYANHRAATALLHRATAVHQITRRPGTSRRAPEVPPPVTEPVTAPDSVADAVAELDHATAAAERARARLVQALRAENEAGTSANRLADAAAGVMSRPLVLRALRKP